MSDPSTVTLARPAALAAAALLVALPAFHAPAAAQQMDHGAHGAMELPETGQRADLASDIEDVAGKFTALAEVLEDHWDWRPAEGVRSVGEVFGHVAAANMMLPTLVGIDAPEGFRGADPQSTMGNLQALEQLGPAELAAHLDHSFVHARHSLARLPDERLAEPVTFFGQEGTVGSLMTLVTTHMHEHLGQLIAYARMNGVVPPWSEAGQ